LRALERGGTCFVNAIHLDRIPEFPYDLLYWERRLVSVANFTRRDAAEFLQLAQQLPIRTTVEQFPLIEANLELRQFQEERIPGMAVLAR
ncbi:MAG: alcohol dehydrogenase, partial [Candidatus Dormiibacterota bacterium]